MREEISWFQRRARFTPSALTLAAGILGGCSSAPGSSQADAGYTFGPKDAGGDASYVVAGYTPTAAETAAFDQLLTTAQQVLAAGGAPGASIAVVLRGKLAFAAGVGKRSLTPDAPVTTRTLFGVGSMTKVVTAASVFAERDRGKLDPSAPVSQILPWLELSSGPVPSSFTTSSLLSMTSGLAADTVGFCGSPMPATSDSRTAFFKGNHLPLWFPPGAAYVYSNTGYSLLATIVEAAAGAGDGQFEQLAHDLVLAQAGMTSATFDMTAAQNAEHATGYVIGTGGRVEAVENPETSTFDCAMVAPAGGLFATASDFGHLVEVLLAGGGSVLTSASVTAMQTPVVDEDYFPGVTFGEGLEQWTWPALSGGHVIQRKDGDLPGYISVMQIVPDLGFGVVVLVNGGTGTGPAADDISYAALEDFLSGTSLSLPSFTSPSSAWGALVGGYDDRWGWLGAGVKVTLGAGDGGGPALLLTAPNASHGIASGKMTQEFADTWILPGSAGVEATFFGPNGGPSIYLATRFGVGARAVDGGADAGHD